MGVSISLDLQSRLLFVHLPVRDLDASKAFFASLGFAFDAKFTNDSAACMLISEQACVMLVARARFADFTTRPVADARTSTEALLCLSAPSREAVDTFADAALRAGASPGGQPQDHGFMYGRDFTDLDGHLWSVIWMSPEAAVVGPACMTQAV